MIRLLIDFFRTLSLFTFFMLLLYLCHPIMYKCLFGWEGVVLFHIFFINFWYKSFSPQSCSFKSNLLSTELVISFFILAILLICGLLLEIATFFIFINITLLDETPTL